MGSLDKTFSNNKEGIIAMKHKSKDTKKVKRKSGRPVENVIEPIEATPLEVAKAIMQGPVKKQWEYLNS